MDIQGNLNISGVLTLASGLSAGSASRPGLVFQDDLDTGIFKVGANDFAFAAGGTKIVDIYNNQLATIDGSASVPPYGFYSEGNTGMYLVGTNILGFAASGVEVMRLNGPGQQVSVGVGSVTLPTISFTGDLNTGVYSANADEIDFTCGGGFQFAIRSASIRAVPPIIQDGGSRLIPGYSFTNDQNTGLFSAGADIMEATAGGYQVAQFLVNTGSLTQIAATSGTAGVPAYSFFAAGNQGMYFIDASTLGFSVAGVNTMRMASTNTDGETYMALLVRESGGNTLYRVKWKTSIGAGDKALYIAA